ncbi:MAG: arsenate reductase ArsC [Anaerolineae bacterium]|nr:arsenate reductase ArsC [Anaerolineae bacterium]
MNKLNVLFLCTGNTARSQMAEALLRKYAGDRFNVYSAGIEPGVFNPFTRQVLEEIGINTSEQYSKGVEVYLGKLHFAYLVTVCARAEERCPTVFPGVGKRQHWAFDDPAAVEGSDELKLREFRRVRNEIDTRVQAWLNEDL